MDPPGLENFLNVFLSSRWKVVGMDPPRIGKLFWMHFWVQDLKLLNGLLRSDIWWKLWKFYLAMYSPMIHADLPIHFFPISWGPFQDVNLLYFLLKMQIWNGCNVLNTVGNPIKDININLSFLSSRWKVVEWSLSGLDNFLNAFLSSGSKVVVLIPLGTDIWWKFWKFYFSMYNTMIHANLP